MTNLSQIAGKKLFSLMLTRIICILGLLVIPLQDSYRRIFIGLVDQGNGPILKTTG